MDNPNQPRTAEAFTDCVVVIPAYNEARSIAAVVRDARRVLPGAAVLVVNDCSRDDTARVARQAGAQVLDLPFNLGIGGALQAGYRFAAKAGFAVAARLDGDGQHPAEYLPRMVEMVRRGEADVVVGSRFLAPAREGYQSTLVRRAGIRYLSGLLSFLVRTRVTDPTSGFRVGGRRMIELAARSYPRDYPEPESIVMWGRNGVRFCEVPVHMLERQAGRSSIGALSTFYYLFKVSLGIVLSFFLRPKAR